MRKMFTPNSFVHPEDRIELPSLEIGPSEETIKNILQFAAAYRVEKVSKDQFVDFFLN